MSYIKIRKFFAVKGEGDREPFTITLFFICVSESNSYILLSLVLCDYSLISQILEINK